MADLISSDLDFDEKNSWRTEPRIFNALNREFDFAIDAAASAENHLCPIWFSQKIDALKQDWAKEIPPFYKNKTVFVNPPYSRGFIKKFMQKAVEEKHKGVTTVMLVPATLDAQWLPIDEVSEIRIITGGRLSFYHPVTGKKVNGNTKGSMIVIFKPSKMPLVIRPVDRNELLGSIIKEV